MQIKANLLRKPSNLRPSLCQVEKVVEIPGLEFEQFLIDPQQELPFIAENCVMMHEWNGINHCLLVLGKDRRDGVLVQSDGKSHALYAAHVPEAWAIIKAKLMPAANYIICGVTNANTLALRSLVRSWTTPRDLSRLKQKAGLPVTAR